MTLLDTQISPDHLKARNEWREKIIGIVTGRATKETVALPAQDEKDPSDYIEN